MLNMLLIWFLCSLIDTKPLSCRIYSLIWLLTSFCIQISDKLALIIIYPQTTGIHAINCEINQNFKGDLIKFCEIFTKITLELPKLTKTAKKLLF